jgi:hypothetical protein
VLTLFCIAIVFWLGIFPPSTPRVFLNQRRAVQSIGNLNLAEHEYAVRHPDKGFACDLGNLGEQATLVDPVLASGTKSAYNFEIRCPKSGHKATTYTITAIPVEPGRTGEYALCADQSGEIWYSEDGSPSNCLRMHKPVGRKYK